MISAVARLAEVFPQEPLEAAQPDSAKAGPVFYRAGTDDALFVFGCLDDVPLPSGRASPSDLDSVYAATWSMLEVELKRTIDRELKLMKIEAKPGMELRSSASRPAIVGGLPGQQKDFTSDLLEIHAEIVLSGKRMFVVLAWFSIETPLAMREGFFQALRLRPVSN